MTTILFRTQCVKMPEFIFNATLQHCGGITIYDGNDNHSPRSALLVNGMYKENVLDLNPICEAKWTDI